MSSDNKTGYLKPILYALSIIVYFFITAIVSVNIGKYIDNTYNTSPYGYVSSLVIGYIISLVFMIILITRLSYFKKTKK